MRYHLNKVEVFYPCNQSVTDFVLNRVCCPQPATFSEGFHICRSEC